MYRVGILAMGRGSRFVEVLTNLMRIYETRGSGAVSVGNVREVFSVMRNLFIQSRSRFWRVCLGIFRIVQNIRRIGNSGGIDFNTESGGNTWIRRKILRRIFCLSAVAKPALS